MKKVLLAFIICFITLTQYSCGSDEPKNQSDDTKEEQRISRSIIGVWTNGQYFVSFSKDNHYAAYLDWEYLESGSFEANNDSTIITCKNDANGNITTYAVSFSKYTISINPPVQGFSMQSNVKYINLDGKIINKSIDFMETDLPPVTDGNNPLKGKKGIEYKEHSLAFTFNGTSTGIVKSSDPNYSAYPLPFNYIFIKNRLYLQKGISPKEYPIIEGWNDNHFVSTYEVSPLSEDMIKMVSKDFLGF